jgi:hypothetical protein
VQEDVDCAGDVAFLQHHRAGYYFGKCFMDAEPIHCHPCESRDPVGVLYITGMDMFKVKDPTRAVSTKFGSPSLSPRRTCSGVHGCRNECGMAGVFYLNHRKLKLL